MNCYSIFDLNFLVSLKEKTKHIQNIESKERKRQRKDKSAEQKE